MDQLIQDSCPLAAGGQARAILGGMVQLILTSFCDLGDSSKWPEDKASMLLGNDVPQFDFIVVGAGSAGSVVASRLTEKEDYNVLLLEAGGDPPADTEVPAFLFANQNTNWDWKYRTEKSPGFCLAMVGQRCSWPRGKTLGGSSAINAMLYVRGNRADYDEWEMMGNPGWGYDSVVHYFKKAEHLKYPFPEINNDLNELYGNNGPLNVEPFNSTVRWKEVVKSAWSEVGEKVVPDINVKSQCGITDAMGTIGGGERCSTAKSYLRQAKDRKNLYVVKKAQVLKLIIDDQTKTVTGVLVKIKDKELTINARKEVIVSAGAINTPQLLMLSGIGPKAHLEELGIKVVADLPVGKHLLDHIIFPVLFSVDEAQSEKLTNEIIQEIISEYLKKRSGVLSTTGMTDLLGFIDSTGNGRDVPDVQYHHIYHPIDDGIGLPYYMSGFGYDEEFVNFMQGINKVRESFTAFPTLLKPKSQGEVKLRSRNPFDPPLIYAEYYKDDEDLKTLLRGTRFLEKLENTKSFQKYRLRIEHVPLTNCISYEFKTQEYWRCVIRNLASTVYHPVGTAKMGPSDDKEAVVDPQLKVHGIKALRVIDASIMPDIVRGNTNSGTIMIGEKGADMIKADWV